MGGPINPGLQRGDLPEIDAITSGLSGTGDLTAVFDALVSRAIVENKILRIRNGGAAIRIDGQCSKVLTKTDSLRVECDPGVEFDIRNASSAWLDVSAQSIGAFSLGDTPGPDALSIQLADASSVEPGNVLSMKYQLLMENGWKYPAVEVFLVNGKAGNVVSVADKTLFPISPKAEQNWVATGGSPQVFWYPSYYTASTDIEVLVNGVVVTPVSITERSGNANNFGFDVAINTSSGDAIQIRRLTAATGTIYRGGFFSWSGGKFSSTQSDLVGIVMTGLYRANVSGCSFYFNTKNVGTHISAHACYAPQIENIDIDGGLYPLIFHAGTKAPSVKNLRGTNAHNVIATGFFVDGLVADGISGYLNDGVFDTHPSFNTTLRNCTSFDTDFPNTRGVGVTWKNVTAVATSDVSEAVRGFISWIDNGATNGPKALMDNRFDSDFTNVRLRYASGGKGKLLWGVARHIGIENVDVGQINGVYDGDTGTDKQISITSSRIDFLLLRYGQTVNVFGGTIKKVDFFGASTDVNTLTFTGTRFENASATFFGQDHGDNVLGQRTRTFIGCDFASSTSLVTYNNVLGGTMTNNAWLKYRFISCAFRGISDFGTLASGLGSAEYIGCHFGLGVPPQKQIATAGVVSDSTATDVSGLNTNFNSLLSELRLANIIG